MKLKPQYPALALLLTASLFVPVAAAAEELPAVAVMDFGASNAPATEASVITDFVRSAAIRSGKFRVVDKKNMQALLTEQAFQQSGCTSSECAVKLGKILNVQKMIVGEYAIMGGVRYLSAHLVAVESGVMEKDAKVKGFDGGNADTAADKIITQLTGAEFAATDSMSTESRKPQGPVWDRQRFFIGIGGAAVSAVGQVDYSKWGHGPFSNAVKEFNSGYPLMGMLELGYRSPLGDSKKYGWGIDVMGSLTPKVGTDVSIKAKQVSTGAVQEFNGALGVAVMFSADVLGTAKIGPVISYAGVGWYWHTFEPELGDYKYVGGGSSTIKIGTMSDAGSVGLALRAGVEIPVGRAMSLDMSASIPVTGSEASSTTTGHDTNPAWNGTIDFTHKRSSNPWGRVALKYYF